MNEVVENLRKDLMLLEKNKSLLQSYLNLGGDNNFFSINNDQFGSGGEEVIKLFSQCILLIEHCLENADEGSKINKKFMFEKLDLYDIEECLAKCVMPNVFNAF